VLLAERNTGEKKHLCKFHVKKTAEQFNNESTGGRTENLSFVDFTILWFHIFKVPFI